MYPEERQQAMSSLVAQRGRSSVTQLADRFGVTTETVRRDLAVLERQGLVRRVHGGAVPATSLTVTEPVLAERESTRTDLKDRIGKRALEFLPAAGGSILLDAGTTTSRMLPSIPTDRELTVITNSVPIAARLAGLPAITLQLLGGRVRGVTQAAVGEDTLRALDVLRVDVAFVGTNALSVEHGLSTPDPEEAAVKRAMVRSARQVVAVADSSKLGREYLVSFAPADAVDVLVTDAGIDPVDREELTRHGIEVVTA
ncbi:DeoR/GlpR transcriptional regulator [Rhodococcus triatomae]|uniref:Lactose phosphotransferase system repressor n=1 Tax=Rhodococcus triatomae TaxID=300028 RepID=A0A1G8MVA7_9NOCA|nr:DeoR/GlpR family DNA-binding transcription regulator [Rhodococcus triatomae]QNG21363.1 DeoR/GlpR transcriptional regulator [Rhodococcus triatomae]QNG25898.1 DeoR/GlpR transcriptional regulator [Rhodococcus triatomae]SDI71786.1 DeoR family transcriptional regulator, fructose operon transcriptional repressor [Rhodococcus triatomae]